MYEELSMTDNANVFVTFTGGPYTTHLTFDNPSVGNYIGTLGGFPSIIGNSAVQLVGGSGQAKINASGLNLANNDGNITITVPSSAQVANTQLFLKVDGTWGVPPGTTPPITGYSGTVDVGDAVNSSFFRFVIANGIITSVT